MRIVAATTVSVFVGPHAAGNAATVLRLADWPADPAAMQAEAGARAATIAFLPADAPDPCPVRWFSGGGEIALCGHGALAAGAASGPRTFVTAQGEHVPVTHSGDSFALSLLARMPVPTPLDAVVAAIGCDPHATLAHPDRYAVIVLADEAAVRACRPDPAALAVLGDWQVIVTAPGTDCDIVSRVWSPGGSEDTATGSAHAVIGPWWAARLGRPRLVAHQASPAGGRIACTVDGDRVTVSGRCVVQAASAAGSVASIQPPPSTRSPA